MKLALEKYILVRGVQANGARTIDELKNLSDIVIESEEEAKEIEAVLKQVCKCKNVSVETAVNAVKNGADTLEKLMEVTSAGTACGKCKRILTNVLETGR